MRKYPPASEYLPAPEAVRIARERTQDILKLWTLSIDVYNSGGIADFGVLVQSAYLQGVEDAGVALGMRGLLVMPRVEGSYEEER